MEVPELKLLPSVSSSIHTPPPWEGASPACLEILGGDSHLSLSFQICEITQGCQDSLKWFAGLCKSWWGCWGEAWEEQVTSLPPHPLSRLVSLWGGRQAAGGESQVELGLGISGHQTPGGWGFSCQGELLGWAQDPPGLRPSCPSLRLPRAPVTPFLLSGEGEGVGSEVTRVSTAAPPPAPYPVSPGLA